MDLTRDQMIESIKLLEEQKIRQERARIIPKLAFLYQPMRYKVSRGGRGAAKSWEYARAILKLGLANSLRILCTREVQKSLKDSVYKLLCDQIQRMGMGRDYLVLDSEIRGNNGTLIIFSGLADHTVESIKSFEGIDICWIEEAQTVSKKSWDILIPTIRKDGSEIWVSYNPVLDTDETHKRFSLSPPPNSIVVEINYNDNPWFPKVLEDERAHCKLTEKKEDYENIWEGKCRTSVAGAIYSLEIAESHRSGRICNVPYDPGLKVHAVWDLGWNDSMSITLVQKLRSEIRIIDYIEDDHKTLDYYAGLLKSRPYNWGFDFLPHDGDHSDYKTGKSAKEILEKFGRKVKITPNIPIESGIKMARGIFHQVYFDKTFRDDANEQFKGPGRLVECLKRYRRSINSKTEEAGSPVHDEYSHGGDCFRYVAVNVEKMTNEDEMLTPVFETFTPLNSSMNY